MYNKLLSKSIDQNPSIPINLSIPNLHLVLPSCLPHDSIVIPIIGLARFLDG